MNTNDSSKTIFDLDRFMFHVLEKNQEKKTGKPVPTAKKKTPLTLKEKMAGELKELARRKIIPHEAITEVSHVSEQECKTLLQYCGNCGHEVTIELGLFDVTHYRLSKRIEWRKTLARNPTLPLTYSREKERLPFCSHCIGEMK